MLVPGVGKSRVRRRYAGFALTTRRERELVLVLVPGVGKSRAPRYAGFAPTTPSERELVLVVGIGESPDPPAGALIRASNCLALPVHFPVRKGRKGRKESRIIPSCVGFRRR